MADLLDVELLGALLLPEHQHHPASIEWCCDTSRFAWLGDYGSDLARGE